MANNNTGNIPSPAPIAVVVRTGILCIDFCGLLLFGAIIIVTVRHKKLHGTCHLLLALFCACNFFSKSVGILPYLIFMWPSIEYIMSYNLLVAIEFLPSALMHGVHPFMFLVGFDRLMSIAFPIWYKTKNGKLYFLAVLAIPIGFEIFIAILMYLNMAKNNEVLAFNSSFKTTSAYPIVNFLEIGFNLLSFACYILMIAIMLYNQKMDQSSSSTSFRQSLYKSMFLIILLQFVCWMITLLGQMVFYYLKIPIGMPYVVPALLNLFIAIASNLEVPLLYSTSTAHRNALRTDFGWLLLKKNNSAIGIQTIPIVPMPTSNSPTKSIERHSGIWKEGNPDDYRNFKLFCIHFKCSINYVDN